MKPFNVRYYVLVLIMLSAIAGCQAPEATIISIPPAVFHDESGQLGIDEVLTETFTKLDDLVPNLGTNESAVWVKLSVEASNGTRAVEIQSPNIDTLSFFQVVNGAVVAHLQTGEAYPFSLRPVKSANFVFQLAQTERESDVYLRIVSGKQVLLPVSVTSLDTIKERQNSKDIFFGVYSGIILVMFLYNFFIWFTVNDRNYLYYVFFILFVGITQLTLNGYGNQFFWSKWPWVGLRSVHLTGVLSGVTTVLFAQSYLRIRHYSRWINYLLYFYLVVYGVAAVLALKGAFIASYNAVNFCAAASLLLVIAAIRSYRRGLRQAIFFLIAFSIFLIGVTVYVLRDFGVLPYNLITQYALPVGSALQVILLSFALADNINQLKREKEVEQEAKLEALKENERIITEQNIILESKVDERTHELAASNDELNKTLTTLRSAQAQLVDAEKMASLGQMTAGIAHELNNPINFVSSNISPLTRDIDEIFEVLEKYTSIDPDDANIVDRIGEASKLAIDYDTVFLRTEVSQLLKGISEGANRTAEIVKGLRIFSRLDEDTIKRADINECIRSTLVILKSNIRSDARVFEQLEPALPELNCYPGKLNQVFMNILVNAMQATAASGRAYEERRVEVTTTFDDNNVYVSISDNGTGIPPEIKAKIFDPFFTTKEVGQGTGLGLSIVLGIINDHNGTITVDSTPGEGTVFLLTLSRTL